MNQKKPTSKDKKSNDGIEYISFKNEAQGVFKDRRFTQRKSSARIPVSAPILSVSQENCILTRYRITYGVSMTAKKPFTEQKKREALLEFHTVLVY